MGFHKLLDQEIHFLWSEQISKALIEGRRNRFQSLVSVDSDMGGWETEEKTIAAERLPMTKKKVLNKELKKDESHVSASRQEQIVDKKTSTQVDKKK